MLNSTQSFEISLPQKSVGITVVVDECAASYNLVVALLKAGYTVIFLGKGIDDSKIINYLKNNREKFFISLDVELDSRLPYETSILLNAGMTVKENLHLIKKFTESTTLTIQN